MKKMIREEREQFLKDKETKYPDASLITRMCWNIPHSGEELLGIFPSDYEFKQNCTEIISEETWEDQWSKDEPEADVNVAIREFNDTGHIQSFS